MRQRRSPGAGIALAALSLAITAGGARLDAQSTAPTASAVPAAAAPVLDLSPAQVLAHLNLTIEWFRRVAALEQSPVFAGDPVTRDRIHRLAVTAVQFAFAFSDSAAALVSAPAASPGGASTDSADDAARMDRAATRMAARVATIRARLADLDGRLAAATSRDRAALAAQRAQVAASLALALEVQKTVLELRRFAATSAAAGPGGSSSLRAQVRDLERTVPEVRRTSTGALRASAAGTTASDTGVAPPAGPPPGAATTEAPLETGALPTGLFALGSQWLSLRGTRRQLETALTLTDSLATEIDTLRMDVSRQSRTLIRANLADTTPVAPGEEVAAQRRIEDATQRFKRLSTVIVPLSEQDITVDDAQGALMEVGDAFRSRSSALARSLTLRAGLLFASIALVLILSELWRRATFRYLHDPRRRRQFLLLRRVLVAVALLAILLAGFVSELGSLATYVGFLTAGLAVALQNVILAIVAYFFLIGRYGVKIGDRITLAGVTGRVVDIGLIRISLMELAGAELQATGRIVVMSNAVLFKPEALFKQIPGADYVWHTVTITLAPTTDPPLVRDRLKAAADRVYAGWRSAIDTQHAAVQRLVDFDTVSPEPIVDVRFTEQAFEFIVRYPVLPDHAAANDQIMLHALRDSVAGERQVTEAATASAAG